MSERINTATFTTLVNRPPAAHFGIGKCTILDTGITYESDGVEWVSSENNELTWTTKPSASEFGEGYAWFSDLGSLAYCDGVNWNIPGYVQLLQKSKGWLIPSLAAANAATYVQSGVNITVTSTGHLITAVQNGKDVFLAMGTAATGATIAPGWFSNFTYVDANTFTCTSAASQTGTGSVNTNLVETVVTELTTAIPANLMGANGLARIGIDATYINSANVKTIRAYFGGSIYLNYGPTTTGSFLMPEKLIKNRNSTAKQHLGINAQITGGAVAGAPVYATVNTANAVSMTFSGINSVANEFICIETATIAIKRAL